MLITRAKMEVMKDILAEMSPKPKIIFELGTYVGNSAVGWAAILRDIHGLSASGSAGEEVESGNDGTRTVVGSDDLHVYTMEFDPEIARCARDLIRLSGLEDMITVMEGPASESIKKLHAEGKVKAGELDMVFIDHWEKYYVPDLQVCENLRLFHQGSIAAADNTIHPGAPTYLKYVQAGGSGEEGSVRYKTRSVTVEKEEQQVQSFLPSPFFPLHNAHHIISVHIILEPNLPCERGSVGQ